MRNIKKVCFICYFLPLFSYAQRIENMDAFHAIGSEKYFRFHYDNDFFTATDKYYTQGYDFEVVHPALKKNPLTKVLISLKNSQTKFGLALDHFRFTPTSIRHDEILYGDRPFAACILLKTFSISLDTLHKSRLSAALCTGGIGQVAFGEAEQTAIHRWIHDVLPHGWQNQIQNDVILNYELNYEKQLVADHFLSVNSNLQMRVGTLNDKIQGGFTLMAGKFNSPFARNYRKNTFQLYFYNQPLVSFVAYDATLQGGVFNRSSPYIIAAADISRITWQDNFGVVLQAKKIYLEYSQAILSKEFSTGTYHRWGGIRIGFEI